MAKCLLDTGFLKLMKSDKDFFYAERRGVDSTATLCYKKENEEYLFLIRYQMLPI